MISLTGYVTEKQRLSLQRYQDNDAIGVAESPVLVTP